MFDLSYIVVEHNKKKKKSANRKVGAAIFSIFSNIPRLHKIMKVDF